MESEIRLLQDIELQAADATTAADALDKIAEIVNKVVAASENAASMQTLNIGFRIYYKLLYEYKLQDKHFEDLFDGTSIESQAGRLQMIHSVLLSERGRHIDPLAVKETFLAALKKEIDGCSAHLLLKNINLLLKKHPKLDTDTCLAHIYVYLQSNETGMRDEALTFFNHCCRSEERAREFFQFIITHYPWTNRNKLYMLSSILNFHSLDGFLEQTKRNDFFAGLRLSLNYKHLLPASQYLIKSLSKQGSLELLELSATVLTRGTFREAQNFYSNWFPRIDQKELLFQLLLSKEEVQESLLDLSAFKTSSDSYRFILIFVMYSRQILDTSKLHFFKIITELITNYFEFEKDAQYLIYKFVAENMSCFALEDCLEFLFELIRHNRGVENAQMRNNVLGKVPTIVNYIAKEFWRSQKSAGDSSSLHAASVESFFGRLHQIVIEDIQSKTYQEKIFALKLLSILLKSLYQEDLERTTKNCNLAQNERLGVFLISRRIFDARQVNEQLVKALNDPQGFDDALDLIVELLRRLKMIEPGLTIEACQKCCQSVDIDECALSAYYARAELQSRKNEISSSVLYDYAFDRLRKEIPSFQRDALLCCKQRNHLFGYLETINEVLLHEAATTTPKEEGTLDFKCSELLDLIETVERMILEFLNLNGQCEEQLFAASFHDMDRSLQALVEQSTINAENHEESRKFLLMSFWLTLKTCCDIATTLGFHFTTKQQSLLCADSITAYTKNIQRCLNLHTTLLTRCRHKGAIEAAGLSIGKLTRKITSHTKLNADMNKILWEDCLSLLFDNHKSVSTTRRGAGYSIMFLHIIKNDAQPGRPLLKRAMAKIFEVLLQTESAAPPSITENSSNCDRIEALALHYLCVLVKDAEMRSSIYSYYNEIMLAAISKIDDPEWTICNAALQLSGALISKVVGQRQATEFEIPLDWEPAQVTYTEILRHMSKTFERILVYCSEEEDRAPHRSSRSTRSIILFLGFLSKIEHLEQDTEENDEIVIIRELMWSLLRHACERVRKLAANCFVRSHGFKHLLQLLLHISSDIVFRVRNENFFEGLLFVISEGFQRVQNEAVHTIASEELSQFYKELRENLFRNAKFETKFKPYTLSRLLDTLVVVGGLDNISSLISDLSNSMVLSISSTKFHIGYEEWSQSYEKFKKGE